MNDPTAPRGPSWRRGVALIAALAFAGTGCAAEPCECPPPPAAAAPSEPAVVAGSPRAQLALDTLGRLFARDFAPVRALLTEELRSDLTDGKLADIVASIVDAHGPPVRVMDAWTSTITEKKEVMPAAEVLVRMTNETRVGLILVFDPQGAVKGLWLRPI